VVALIASLSVAGHAWADEPKEKTAAKVEKKAEGEKLDLYGLELKLGLGSYNALTTAGEGEEWYLRYSFNLDWSFGKVFWPKTKVLNAFKARLTFRVQNEMVGTDPRYRTTNFANPNYSGSQMEYLPISDQGGYLDESDAHQTDRTVSGAYRRADYSDVWLTIMNSSLYTIPKAKINIDAALRVTLPTSLQSRNKGLRTYIMSYAGLTRGFSLPYNMKLFAGYGFYWVHYFWKSDVPHTKDNFDSWEDPNTGVSSTDDYDYPASSYNPHDAVYNSLWVNLNFLKKFNFYVDYTYMWIAPYQPDDYCIVDLGNGTTTNACENTYDVRGYSRPQPWEMRTSQMFTMSLSYAPLPYLKVAAGLTTVAPERKPNSQDYQQAFLVTNYNRYSMFMLNLTFYTGKLLKSVYGKGAKKKKAKSLEDITG
jgi:hypothetical protein